MSTTGAASTTVCAPQASMGVTVSVRLDPVSRQGEYWTVGGWEGGYGKSWWQKREEAGV